MNVYITYRQNARGFVVDLAGILMKAGHEVFYDKLIPLGSDWSNILSEKIVNADAIIAVFIGSNNDNIAFEVGLGLAHSDKLIIPVVIGEGTVVPYDVRRIQGVYIDSLDQFSEAANTILLCLETHKARLKKDAEETEESAKLLDRGIKNHIETILKSLEKREKRNKEYSIVLYVLSAISLVLTILPAEVFLLENSLVDMQLEKLIAFGIVYLFIAILMVSISKFMFTLAKSFMVEAIRTSDRIHAISFGKFYIEAFDEKVTREEVIKIFSAWNIDNGGTNFKSQSSDDYDPKLLEKLLDFIGLAKKS